MEDRGGWRGGEGGGGTFTTVWTMKLQAFLVCIFNGWSPLKCHDGWFTFEGEVQPGNLLFCFILVILVLLLLQRQCTEKELTTIKSRPLASFPVTQILCSIKVHPPLSYPSHTHITHTHTHTFSFFP